MSNPEEDGRYKPTSSIVAAVLALSGHIAEQNMTLDQGTKALCAFSEELEEIAQSAGKDPTGSLKSMITVNANRILLLDMARVFEDYKRTHGLIDFFRSASSCNTNRHGECCSCPPGALRLSSCPSRRIPRYIGHPDDLPIHSFCRSSDYRSR